MTNFLDLPVDVIAMIIPYCRATEKNDVLNRKSRSNREYFEAQLAKAYYRDLMKLARTCRPLFQLILSTASLWKLPMKCGHLKSNELLLAVNRYPARIHHLDISFSNATTETVLKLLSYCPQLAHIYVDNCENVDVAELASSLEALTRTDADRIRCLESISILSSSAAASWHTPWTKSDLLNLPKLVDSLNALNSPLVNVRLIHPPCLLCHKFPSKDPDSAATQSCTICLTSWSGLCDRCSDFTFRSCHFCKEPALICFACEGLSFQKSNFDDDAILHQNGEHLLSVSCSNERCSGIYNVADGPIYVCKPLCPDSSFHFCTRCTRYNCRACPPRHEDLVEFMGELILQCSHCKVIVCTGCIPLGNWRNCSMCEYQLCGECGDEELTRCTDEIDICGMCAVMVVFDCTGKLP